MNEHLNRLESGEQNKINADKQKGVSSGALCDFVYIDHYVMPTLHLMLGIFNYLYKNMVEESQGACEGYSLDYVEAERIWELPKYDAATAKTNKKQFQATNGFLLLLTTGLCCFSHGICHICGCRCGHNQGTDATAKERRERKAGGNQSVVLK